MTTFHIITRHLFTRPNSLKQMATTVQAQTYPHFTHNIITDTQGRGIIWADGWLAHIPAQADYVLTIDDDDLLARPTALARLAEFIEANDNPPAVICKMISITHGQLPLGWKQEPLCGTISGQNMISRADVWNSHRQAWAHVVPGDWGYINSVWKQHWRGIRWMDDILIDQQYRGLGRGEDEIDE